MCLVMMYIVENNLKNDLKKEDLRSLFIYHGPIIVVNSLATMCMHIQYMNMNTIIIITSIIIHISRLM